MRKPFKIGKKEYKFKKDAIAHYKFILNSYDFGQILSDSDYDDIIDLIDYDWLNNIAASEILECDQIEDLSYDEEGRDVPIEDEEDFFIDCIKVSKVQFKTKCFEIFFSDNTSQYISYLMMINTKKQSSESLFSIACRNSIHKDIHSVKQKYFDDNSSKGLVKCQETGVLSKWTELVIDHRQPNTFSMIVERFKEINGIDLDSIEYETNEQNFFMFKDLDLTHKFKKYHKEKASLRLVRKECNLSRSGMAVLKQSGKDLTIE